MIANERTKDINVLRLIPSPKNIYVKAVKHTIPVEKPINRLGHSSPLKYPTTIDVA